MVGSDHMRMGSGFDKALVDYSSEFHFSVAACEVYYSWFELVMFFYLICLLK